MTTTATLERGPGRGRSRAEDRHAAHPRRIGWVGTSALAMGGSNQSLFIIGALIAAQGPAAVPILAVGLLLSWLALPGWTELVCMWPSRVGGIAGACAEAFRPYSPVLANLTGVCYWWGWVPTCGLTALLSASALHSWYLPGVPVHLLAAAIVLAFTAVCLCGIQWVTRLATTIAAGSASLALVSGLTPLLTGRVDARAATSWHLEVPFAGHFGMLTSAMAGLYLVGFAAPAFEAAACHVGETKDPARNVPRAMLASAGMANVYFLLLPVVWLGFLGPAPLAGSLAASLGPTFGPVFGAFAKSAAVWFLVLNMFHGTLQPLAGAARTLSQLSEDGLLPRVFARRNRRDVPWVVTALTAVMSIAFLMGDDPPPVIAAANFTYLLGICLPSVAVWLLRRDEPALPRPWRAPRFTVGLGLFAACVWGLSALLGFEQFGLNYVIFGLGLAFSGSALFALRRWRDRRDAGLPRQRSGLQLKLTGAMLGVVALDGIGYLLAVRHLIGVDPALVALLKDLFVGVALLTITVGLVLPGMVAHQAIEVRDAAHALETGTLAELTRAMRALGDGDLQHAHATPQRRRVRVRSADELGEMAASFNRVQDEAARAAVALDRARDQLVDSREHLRTLADSDHLTGLHNRRWFERELATLLAVDHPCTLVLIDLDNFKLVNDSRGHQVGDEVLRRTAEVLTAWAPAGSLVARLGGDEFAVVLVDAGAAEAELAAQQLLADLEAGTGVHDAEGRRVRIGASVGIAPSHGAAELSGLLVEADMAMYEAKRGGRNRLAVAQPAATRTTELRSRADWVESLRDAIDEDRFELWGQPITDVRAGLAHDVAHYEVLLRMRDSEGGLVMPSQFLGLAEHTGMVGDIDRWVVGSALHLMRERTAAGDPVSLCVNLSGLSVGDPRMLEFLRDELRGGGFDPTRLVLEVTETAAIANVEDARAFAQELSALGPTLALDDFGSGFSSFAYLKHLPFGIVKIDGDFVRTLPESKTDREVVKAIVGLARGLGIRTVAEFVENAETFELLAALGVDLAQGYHLGRPEPLRAMLRRADRAAGIPVQRKGSAAPARSLMI